MNNKDKLIILNYLKHKEDRIKNLVLYLFKKFGVNSFKIKDHWDGDNIAIGLVDKNEKYLIYISALKNNSRFFVALENPPIDSDKYEPAGEFENLTLKDLEIKFKKHLRL